MCKSSDAGIPASIVAAPAFTSEQPRKRSLLSEVSAVVQFVSDTATD